MSEPLAATATAAEPAPTNPECPFPGVASYDYDRRASFCGRREEAHSLASMILGRQLTVLVAGSGDGKTSLIHAGIAPMLLCDGIEVAVAEPGGDAPLAEIGKFCMGRLLPSRARSYRLVRRLIGQLDNCASLREARSHCQSLSVKDRQKLLTGRHASRPVDQLEGGALATWLRDPEISDDYLGAVAEAIRCPPTRWPGTDAPLLSIQRFFHDAPPFKTKGLRGLPEKASPLLIAGLDEAIRRRRRTYEDFELVLILDQFEEIFVRFQDLPDVSSADNSNRRRHREVTLNFVREVVRRRWPVRVVLSLRKEHYADLQAAFGDPEGLAAATYHLGPLSSEMAFECLMQPEAWPGRSPNQKEVKAIVDVLTVEERLVNPTLLSVVGEWLWEHPAKSELSEDELQTLIPRAIDAFVRRVFGSGEDGGHGWSILEQQEAIDILEQLIIRDGSLGRRNSVAKSSLESSPLRKVSLRKNLLVALENSRLVRREARLGGDYFEIVHERLIDPLHRLAEELRTETPAVGDLPVLLDEIRAEALELISRPLPGRLLPILFANIERIELPPFLAARMITRLLFDPDLLEGKRLSVRAKITTSKSEGSNSREEDSTMREVLRELADEAGREEEKDKSDPERRMAEGFLVSPAEAMLLLGKPQEVRNPQMLRLIIASSLVHLDVGAVDRIRDCARHLRRGGVT
jgi:hypothetical protein